MMNFITRIISRIKASPLPTIIQGIQTVMSLVIQFKMMKKALTI